MLFIPSVDRNGDPIPQGQEFWVEQCLAVLGEHFMGATAFPPGRGVWKDDDTGELLFEDTVVVISYAAKDLLGGGGREALLNFLMRLGAEGKQGEVGVYIDGEYFGFQDFKTSKPGREEATK
jgi:hypothetical protein